ncbi:hypothetical protein EXU57_23380 [Segetibacter sp. 3557_3]|uniref:protealysin inhibitor emfourin n=1 Tax=Segetibacter sp. 3557_3 TaxID=2547429 RepID=UPI0010585FE6|nr:protealysin inhibitor emfourin [Segetibacter sp. 3557_3]TDH18409.1 hypothetical protein EXU57_23380 [Segetibacter sp. 3557_3]
MKIHFQTNGGFAYLPGMSKPFTIDTTNENAEAADQLENLVQEARFFELPTHSSTLSKGAADFITYTVTVEDGPRAHTITATDPVGDEKLHQLIARLRNLARSAPH